MEQYREQNFKEINQLQTEDPHAAKFVQCVSSLSRLTLADQSSGTTVKGKKSKQRQTI